MGELKKNLMDIYIEYKKDRSVNTQRETTWMDIEKNMVHKRQLPWKMAVFRYPFI